MNDHAIEGEEIWKRFRASPEDYGWFYGTVTAVISERLSHPIALELRNQLAAARKTFGW